MNMREKIARAIALADERNGAAPYEHRIIRGKYAKELLFDEADAVLDALMEPTEEMEGAGMKSDADKFKGETPVREIFRSMIQAAKEGK